LIGVGAYADSVADVVQRRGVAMVGGVGFVVLETAGERICRIEDLLHTAWNPWSPPSQEFWSSWLACTITGPSPLATTPTSSICAAWLWPDQHQIFVEFPGVDGIAPGMAHVIIFDSVSGGAV
jgi:hypothetical protein